MKKFSVFFTVMEMLSELWWASISPQSYDYRQELTQQMWTRVHRKRNPYMLMVGVWTRATTMEVSLKLPQKSKNRITSCITSGSITKRIQVSMSRRELDKLVHFHVTTPKLQTHRLPSPDALPSSLALYCLQENGNENYRIEWSKPDTEREISMFSFIDRI